MASFGSQSTDGAFSPCSNRLSRWLAFRARDYIAIRTGTVTSSSTIDLRDTTSVLPDFATPFGCAIVELAVDTRKMGFRYSERCGTSSDAADAVRSSIPEGFKYSYYLNFAP